MGLKGIISIAGMPGLYKVLVQSKSGFIVESLADHKRMPVASTQRISMLEDISVFTTADDMPLKDVMLKIKSYSEGHEIVDAKSDPSKLREFFGAVVPDFDQERVYPSDMKKMINWFHLIKDIVDVADENEEGKQAEADSDSGAEIIDEPPVKEAEEPVKKSVKKSAKAETGDGSGNKEKKEKSKNKDLTK